jgi:hypothetical protein
MVKIFVEHSKNFMDFIRGMFTVVFPTPHLILNVYGVFIPIINFLTSTWYPTINLIQILSGVSTDNTYEGLSFTRLFPLQISAGGVLRISTFLPILVPILQV